MAPIGAVEVFIGAGLAAIGAFAAFGLLHHVVSGPNRVSVEDEKNAKKLTEGQPR